MGAGGKKGGWEESPRNLADAREAMGNGKPRPMGRRGPEGGPQKPQKKPPNRWVLGKGGGSEEQGGAKLKNTEKWWIRGGHSLILGFRGVPSGSVGIRKVPQRPISATSRRPPLRPARQPFQGVSKPSKRWIMGNGGDVGKWETRN